jgi:hypothetical protein
MHYSGWPGQVVIQIDFTGLVHIIESGSTCGIKRFTWLFPYVCIPMLSMHYVVQIGRLAANTTFIPF